MEHENRTQQNEFGLEGWIERTLDSLNNVYLIFNPDRGQSAFEENIFKPMLEMNATGDEVFKEFESKLEDKGSSSSKQYAPLMISCAYCVQALKAHSSNRELGWSYLANARYWCGVASAGIGIKAARSKTIVATRKATSKKGIDAQKTKNNLMKEKIFFLVRQHFPPGNGCKTRTQAANRIKDEAIAYSKDIKYNLSENRATTTIRDWFDEMPDVEKFLPPKQDKTHKKKQANF
jgi:hypothetical protein